MATIILLGRMEPSRAAFRATLTYPTPGPQADAESTASHHLQSSDLRKLDQSYRLCSQGKCMHTDKILQAISGEPWIVEPSTVCGEEAPC